MNLITIGSSTGGPYLLEVLFKNFPVVNGCYIIIQHLPITFTIPFWKNMKSLTEMNVVICEEETKLVPKTIFLAPAGKHLTIENNRILHLNEEPKVHGVRPAIDCTMVTLKKRFDDKISGFVLTGMGCDGTAGLFHIKEIGGKTFAQEPSTASIKTMPNSAITAGAVDKILNPTEIKEVLIKLGK